MNEWNKTFRLRTKNHLGILKLSAATGLWFNRLSVGTKRTYLFDISIEHDHNAWVLQLTVLFFCISFGVT